ncbi:MULTISPECIES: SDR family NAD(P)-dependent oxidoreductase [unclassified Parafrankia]|uniref:SDR family NAD(P)-dependent oxidoreductase n=1 Tax=unclassified Parafrankia TaxID=2994368 RepID=UPI000DA53C2D|nr:MULTISPECIES: SDR family NAD(P)-dependent oxidoreductase [unclassified Parafrankia]TCJ31908.1 SDR family oxidoreductase [Parafrankia sp. BMG5.11]CAI7974051.1 Short-chain reductase protein NovJ [Frankia sp. Hr75.2]SQE00210.1 Short-chain reductase protein NovJ [Parafrankia sp. Ea1.12]
MTGRTAVVTGGGSGIGEAISRRLAADGALVAILDLDGSAAEAVASSIEEVGGKAVGLAADVADRAAVNAAVDEARGRLGRPTILVNNAGMTRPSPFLEITDAMWEKSLAVNLNGTFYCCQAILPDMLAEGWGRIVNISSSSVHSGTPRLGSYVTAKSGILGLTKVLALEFGPRGITVNTIPPGFIDTPMLRAQERGGLMNVEQQTARTPVGRIGRAEDVAAACAFLVSDEAGYITGQVFGVNGGRNT